MLNGKKVFLLAIVGLFYINAGKVLAAQYYSVAAGSSININEWGICYKVANAAGYPTIYVPTNTSGEWSAFINNHPSHVSLSPCGGLPSNAVVHWYEQTGSVTHLSWALSQLPQQVGTCAGEVFTISHIDYRYIKSFCHRGSTAGGAGDNVVAIKINLPGDPTNYWANDIISYSLGSSGIADSRWNALGPDTQLGPYNGMLCTYLGNGDSEIIVKFAVP